MVMERNEILDLISQETKQINYQRLSTESGSKRTDTIPQNLLNHLSLFAETIEEPQIIGDFNNEKHYLDTLKLVLDSTNETENRIWFFLKEILPTLTSKNRLLDIGPGNFALTKSLLPSFSHITAVDESQYVLNGMDAHLLPHIEFEKISASVVNAEFLPISYDLAVLSHVLYYIDVTQWIDVIKKAYRSLTNHGRMVIVLGGDELQKSELIHHFGGESIEINHLATQCSDIFGYSHVSLFASDEVFITKTRQAMLHIAAFMLKDAKITASKEDLVRYIEDNLKVNDNHYEMSTRQKYIVIKKEQLRYMDIVDGPQTMALFD